MADDVDLATEIAECELDRRIAAARVAVPAGEPGTCAWCGDWSRRIVHNRCAPCREPRRR